jgi:hypothetical protein
VTRLFALVLSVVGCLLVWSYIALQSSPSSPAAAVLCSLALGIMLAYAIVHAIVPEAARVDLVRDPRVITLDDAEPVLLAAFPAYKLTPGVCWHLEGLAAPGCECGLAGGTRC